MFKILKIKRQNASEIALRKILKMKKPSVTEWKAYVLGDLASLIEL